MAAEADAVPPDAQCPVPHARDTPLPPGHPPVATVPPSSLRPPSGEHCIFFRTREDSPSDLPPDSAPVPTREEALTSAAGAYDLAHAPNADHLLVLSSRKSELAVRQAKQVQYMLERRYGSAAPVFQEHPDAHADAHVLRSTLPPGAPLRPVEVQTRTMATAGDNNLRSPLYVIGGEGRAIWTKELEVALVARGVDAIVHSLKDVPTTLPDGLELAAILEREDPRDALVVKAGLPYRTLNEFPRGSVIGTSSVRRVALLRRAFPHLMFSDVRGNINTRLAKLDAEHGPYTALVLAAAGMKRMGLAGRISAYLTAPAMLYSVGQGSLAVEVRTPRGESAARDTRIRALVQSISDWRATWRCLAERALMHRLEGGCSIPLGVCTTFDDHADVEGQYNEHEATPAELYENGATLQPCAVSPDPPAEGRELTMSAVIVSMDGSRCCKHTETRLCKTAAEAEQLGILVADELERDPASREILAEVEMHRRLVEQADARRRADRRAAGEKPPAVDAAEVDCRFAPREDGQPKAWEV